MKNNIEMGYERSSKNLEDVVNENKEEDEKKYEDLNPSLKDYSYEPDIFSHSFMWQTGLFRDPISGARFMWVLPYALPSSDGFRVLGIYDSSTDIFEVDKTHYQRRNTFYHESGHARGDNEYMAENYASLAA